MLPPLSASLPFGPYTYRHIQTETAGCAAENALKEEAKKPQYSLSLLNIVSTAAQPANIRLAAALVPGARCELVAGAGHSVYFERPDVFNALLDRFLKET